MSFYLSPGLYWKVETCCRHLTVIYSVWTLLFSQQQLQSLITFSIADLRQSTKWYFAVDILRTYRRPHATARMSQRHVNDAQKFHVPVVWYTRHFAQRRTFRDIDQMRLNQPTCGAVITLPVLNYNHEKILKNMYERSSVRKICSRTPLVVTHSSEQWTLGLRMRN